MMKVKLPSATTVERWMRAQIKALNNGRLVVSWENDVVFEVHNLSLQCDGEIHCSDVVKLSDIMGIPLFVRDRMNGNLFYLYFTYEGYTFFSLYTRDQVEELVGAGKVNRYHDVMDAETGLLVTSNISPATSEDLDQLECGVFE